MRKKRQEGGRRKGKEEVIEREGEGGKGTCKEGGRKGEGERGKRGEREAEGEEIVTREKSGGG